MGVETIEDNVLQMRSRASLALFEQLCREVSPGLDTARLKQQALETVRYLSADPVERQTLRAGQALEQHWYASIEEGKPDVGVYDADDYLAQLWACWNVYSRRYLRGVAAATVEGGGALLESFGAVARVADLGSGFGFTTAALTKLFPGAVVQGFNLEGRQTAIARRLGERAGFSTVTRLEEIQPVDVVFACEYFDNFRAPIAHLREVVELLAPKVLLMANSFGQKGVGHYDLYEIEDGQVAHGDALPARVAASLKAAGYRPLKTSLWNNRPACWVAF